MFMTIYSISLILCMCVQIQKSDLLNASVYDLIYEKEHQEVHNLLSNPMTIIDPMKNDLTMGKLIKFIRYTSTMYFL